MSVAARWGLAARATIYLLIGVLAFTLASGSGAHEADQRGALEDLSRHTGGALLVWVIGIGLAGYALWRLSEAIFGAAGEGKKVGPRLQSLARCVIYAFFAASAFEIVTRSGGGSQSGQESSWTARLMAHSGGRWLVGIFGIVVIVCGLVLAWQGVRRKFEKYLNLQDASEATRKTVEVLGVVGTVVRGIVFALAGVFVVVAAVEYDPQKAGGLDRALRELDQTPAGPWILGAVALGLVIFGIYGFAEAKWRKV